METRGLIFIPDISGFTRFVHEIEIGHSRAIIQELLEILINANQIGLEVSEIEGDAILFYKYGDPPAMKEIYGQVAKMFTDFHRHLAAYEIRKYCHCKACVSAVNLTLKVITHYGEFTSYSVKNFSKLIGRDIIVAHQLLKNDIDDHEYWLVTESLLHDQNPIGFREWMRWMKSVKHTETGDVPFMYTQIGRLRSEMPTEPFPDLEIKDKAKVISVSRDYDAHIIKMFHATGDFNYRSKWKEGVKKIEEVHHFLPRVGMKCKATLDNGEQVIFSSSYAFHPEKIEFGETDELKKSSHHYTVEKIGSGKTRVTIDYYIPGNLLNQAVFNMTRKKQMEASLQKSLLNLEEFVKDLEVPIIE